MCVTILANPQYFSWMYPLHPLIHLLRYASFRGRKPGPIADFPFRCVEH